MPAESIIKRRLKSLRQIESDKAQANAEREADFRRRAEANGVSVDLQREIDRPNDYARICRPMPLAFYYGEGSIEERDAAFMRRRATFYANCARVFGWEGWSLDQYQREIFLAEQLAGGRDGRAQTLTPIDQKQAVNVDTNAAPLEYLASQNWLETDRDPEGIGHVRLATALRFREIVAGTQAGGLKGQNYEGGSGGFGPRLVSDHALDCMAVVSRIRDRLHPGLYRLLTMIVIDDVWLWELDAKRLNRRILRHGEPRNRRDRRRFNRMHKRLLHVRRQKIILRLHKAIDGAAVEFRWMTDLEFAARWKVRQDRRPSSDR